MAQTLFKIKLCSHHFKISSPNPFIQPYLMKFCSKYVQYGLVKERGKFKMKPVKVFASKTRDSREYRFHINQLAPFLEYLHDNGIKPEQYETEVAALYKPEKIKLSFKDGWELRDYQKPIVDYIVAAYDADSKDPRIATRTKMIPLQTGRGKGMIAIAAMVQLGVRVCILIKPSLIDKWIAELLEKTDIKTKEMMRVQGSDQMRGLIDLAKNKKLTSKIIMVSLTTFRNYIKETEEDYRAKQPAGYGCRPEMFFETLKVGVVAGDEVHLEFHLNYLIKTHSHVPLYVDLSATLVNNNAFIEKMYEVVYPRKSRHEGIEYLRYAKAYPISYEFENPDRIRTQQYGNPMYSHHAFEDSIMRYKSVYNNYIALITFLLTIGYLRDYQKGDKAIIFCASIDMCTDVTRILKQKYPQFDIRRYVEDDPYCDVIEADIRVSTILSSGTAIDIPKLTCAILTVNVDSIQSNLQSFGRLREIPGREVRFYYTYCKQLPKHKEYHYNRLEYLRTRALLIKEVFYNKPI